MIAKNPKKNHIKQSEVIQDTGRSKEDLAMLKKFWPNWIAGIIESKYKDSEKQNDL